LAIAHTALIPLLKGNYPVSIVIGGSASTQAAGLAHAMEGSAPAGLWRVIFLTLSAAILFCVFGAVWSLTQPDKTLAFGEGDTLRMAAAAAP
jgi:hypothetical protein